MDSTFFLLWNQWTDSLLDLSGGEGQGVHCSQCHAGERAHPALAGDMPTHSGRQGGEEGGSVATYFPSPSLL